MINNQEYILELSLQSSIKNPILKISLPNCTNARFLSENLNSIEK